MVCTERIFLVLLIIGRRAAPEMAILSPFAGAGVESPAVVGERQDTWLPVGIATVSLHYSCLLAADSIAQASAKHLFIALCLQPLHPHRVNHTTVCDAVTVWNRLGVSLRLENGRLNTCDSARPGGGGLHGRVPFTLPFPSAVARADALQLVPPVVLLAPGVSDPVGRPSVLVVAPVSRGTGDAPTAFSQTSAVHHHPALVGLFPGFPDNIGDPSSMVKTLLSYGLAGPFSFPVTETHTL